MTEKLYYDDPLIAAYMAREFGVKICLLDNEFSDVCFSMTDLSYAIRRNFLQDLPVINEQYYIHLDSYDIFKPQQGDLITNLERQGWFVDKIELHDNKKYAIIFFNHEKKFTLLEDAQIIQRNGKQFFTPKEDK